MKTACRLLVLALAVGVIAPGCAAEDPTVLPSGGGMPSGEEPDEEQPDTGGKPPAKPLDASGSYALRSTFDLATNMPGTAGTVINTIIDATDGSADPTEWVLDQLIAQLPEGRPREVLNVGKLLAAEWLNTKLLEFAPDFLETMVHVGRDFGEIARHFSFTETLVLTKSATGYTAVRTITGMHYKLGDQEGDFLLANYGLPNVVVSLEVTMDVTGQLTFSAHEIPVAYGQLLRLGIDAAIIPLLDSSARNLGELLNHKINCQRLGELVHARVGIGSATLFATACRAGLNAGAAFVYQKIDDIDGSALQFGLTGRARASDKNADKRIDTIQTGTWAGTLHYAGRPTALIPAGFFGDRQL